MPRFVEVRDAHDLPRQVSLVVGDVLWLWASGAASREEAVERQATAPLQIVGPLVNAVIGSNGAVVSPAGLPNVVVLIAVLPGETVMDLFDSLEPGRMVSVHFCVTA